MACQKDNINNLNGVLMDAKGVKTEYLPFYLQALRNGQYETIEEIEKVVEIVNQTIDIDRTNG
uniref:NAD(+) synthase n=1 Tax=Elaeophora elaphi TaxID=1147741 RepID=A0A0R3RL96_9BILA